MTTQPTLSVCIVTYERRDFLKRCLDSLSTSVTDDVEVIVVDASARPAADVIAESRPSAVYLHTPRLAGWMTRSRNEALKHVRGDIISFLDDDVVVSANWQSSLLAAFGDAEVVAVSGRTRNLQPGEDEYGLPVGRYLDDGSLTEGFASLTDGIIEVDHGIGANMSFRRSILATLGGFRDDYPGTAMREDTDIFLRIRRLGGKVVFAPDAVVDHLPGPHIKGKRFDTRYKLYARRNHMVLVARDSGIRSIRLRRWILREYGEVGEAPTFFRKIRRFGVTTLGVLWGTLAVIRDARWSPTSPVRGDEDGTELRALLSRADVIEGTRRGRRTVLIPPADAEPGDWFYFWLDAHARTRAGSLSKVVEVPGMAPWIDVFPALRSLTVRPAGLLLRDQRERPGHAGRQRFGVDFAIDELESFIKDVFIDRIPRDDSGTVVVSVPSRGPAGWLSKTESSAFDYVGYVGAALEWLGDVNRVTFVTNDAQWCRENLDETGRKHVADLSYSSGDPIHGFMKVAGASLIVGSRSVTTYWASYIAGVLHENARVVMPLYDESPATRRAAQYHHTWMTVRDFT